MAQKKIIQKGDAVLNKKSHPVTKFDQKLHTLLTDMRDTLEAAGGAGLAAPQIGILRRVVLVMDDHDQVIELVNPEIMEASGEQDGLEGCLSLSGLYGFVTRPDHVMVQAQTRDGETFTISGTGLVARCFCHELEHLDGRLFDEHVDRLFTEKQLEAMLEEHKKAGKA